MRLPPWALPPKPDRLRQYFCERINKIGGMLDADVIYNELLWDEMVGSINEDDALLLQTLRSERVGA